MEKYISFEIIFDRLIDEQINIALETRESLVNQREILKVGTEFRNQRGINKLDQNSEHEVKTYFDAKFQCS